MKNHFKIFNAFCLTLFLLLNSCTDENQIIPQQGNEKSTFSVTNKQGILNFSSQEGFKSIMSELQEKSLDERIEWSSKLGFQSMQDVYDEIMEAEMIIDREYEEQVKLLSEKELEELSKLPIRHSPIYEKHLASGLIKLDEEEDSDWFYPNIFNPAYAHVLNLDGLVIVGDTIFQYTAESFKMLTDGNIGRIDILKKATETIEAQNIFVAEVTIINHPISNQKVMSGYDFYKQQALHITSNRKLTGQIRQTIFTWDGFYTSMEFYIMARLEKKNWLGKWVPGDQSWMNLTVDYDVVVTPGCCDPVEILGEGPNTFTFRWNGNYHYRTIFPSGIWDLPNNNGQGPNLAEPIHVDDVQYNLRVDGYVNELNFSL
jgi:hypothetical protein